MLKVQIVVVDVRRSKIRVHCEDWNIRGRQRSACGAEHFNIRPVRDRGARGKGQIENAKARQRIQCRTSGSAVLEALQEKVVLRRRVVIKAVSSTQQRPATPSQVVSETYAWREIVVVRLVETTQTWITYAHQSS